MPFVGDVLFIQTTIIKEETQMTDLYQIIYWIITASTSVVGVVIEIVRLVGERRRRREIEKVGSNRP